MYGSNSFLVIAEYFLCVIIHQITKCDKTREFPPKFRARLKDFVGAPLPRSKGISHPGGGWGGWVGYYSENNATSWPNLQAELFSFSAELKL